MSKNLLITAKLNEIPRNMPWPSAILSDWKGWFPTLLVRTEWTRTFALKVLRLSWTFELSHQYRPVLSQRAAFCHLRSDKQLKESTSSADCEPALSEVRAVVWEMEEESILFPRASLSTGVGTAVIIIIFSTGHNELHQNLLHSLWCFIFSYLLFCSGVWLIWSKRATSRVTALLAPS